MTEERFFPIGVTGYVNEVNPGGYVVIRTAGRVNLDIIGINPDHTIDLTVSRRLTEIEISRRASQGALREAQGEPQGELGGL